MGNIYQPQCLRAVLRISISRIIQDVLSATVISLPFNRFKPAVLIIFITTQPALLVCFVVGFWMLAHWYAALWDLMSPTIHKEMHHAQRHVFLTIYIKPNTAVTLSLRVVQMSTLLLLAILPTIYLDLVRAAQCSVEQILRFVALSLNPLALRFVV